MVVPRAAGAGLDVPLEVRVAVGDARHRRLRVGRQRRPAEVRVDDHAGGVEHAPRASAARRARGARARGRRGRARPSAPARSSARRSSITARAAATASACGASSAAARRSTAGSERRSDMAGAKATRAALSAAPTGSGALVECALCAKRSRRPGLRRSSSTPPRRRPPSRAGRRRSSRCSAPPATPRSSPSSSASRSRRRRRSPASPSSTPAPSWRAEVELLQQKLNWHRGSARVQLLAVDGKFGGKTKAAVIAFKRARRITPHTVTVDATTWEALARPPVSGKPRAGKAGPGLRPHVRGRPARDHDRPRLRRARQRRARDGADHPGPQGGPRLRGERREGRTRCARRPGGRSRRPAACGSSRRTSARRRTSPSTPSCA